MQAINNKKGQRLEMLEHHIERLEKRSRAVSARYQRLFLQQVVVLVGGIILSISLFGIFIPLGLVGVLATIGLFVYGVLVGGALKLSAERYDGLLRIKKTHVARMLFDWDNIPPVEDEREKDHPFENDLQISGPESLHQLINTCYSDQGRARLRQWLLNRVPDPEIMHARQSAVSELTSLVNFRDRLQIHSQRAILDINKQNDQEAVSLWLDLPLGPKPPLIFLIISSIISLVLISMFVLLLYGYVHLIYVAGAFAVSLIWTIPMMRYRARMFLDSSLMSAIFKQLHSVFAFLEKYPTANHPQLQRICEPFQNSSPRPSQLMASLKSVAQAARVTQGPVVTQVMAAAMPGAAQGVPMFFNLIVPWDLFLAYFLAKSKEQAHKSLPLWLDAWYELEALSSLATFAYLNPDYVMPEITHGKDKKGLPALRAEQLGHPLIPDEDRVVNDVTIENVGNIMLITGSNMAGKSTFLRTMGINLCLAYAGSVVSASSLQAGFYEVHCCINVSDSLADGYSYFYAEVRRLRFILDRVRRKTPYPVFVLIDEIFKGTNNRERLIGSHAYICALAEATCISAISTHDLELVTLTDELPQMKNYHFREDVVNGTMVFDYRLYPGPCPTTNALKIMQREGLPITWKKAVGSAVVVPASKVDK